MGKMHGSSRCRDGETVGNKEGWGYQEQVLTQNALDHCWVPPISLWKKLTAVFRDELPGHFQTPVTVSFRLIFFWVGSGVVNFPAENQSKNGSGTC